MRDAHSAAKSASQSRAGAFAELSNPVRAGGSGAPSRRRGTLLALALFTVALLALAPSAIAASPSITGTATDWATILPTAATVKADINPNSEGTSYRVQYVSQAQFESSGFAGASVVPAGVVGIGNGTSSVPVTQQLAGLSPATRYRYRFTATNDTSTVIGPVLVFATFAEEQDFTGTCPGNEALRTGFGAGLPDCRAYEQASPVDKRGANIQNDRDMVIASPDGDGITFGDANGLPTTGGTSRPTIYLAQRGAGGWSTNGLRPLTTDGFVAEFMGLSTDFSTTFSAVGKGNFESLIQGDTATGTWSHVADTITGAYSDQTILTGTAVDDPEHAIFESRTIYATGGVQEAVNVYDVNDGVVTLAGRVPVFPATECDDDGGPACVAPPEGSMAGPYNWRASGNLTGSERGRYYMNNIISADGSKVFFTEGGTGRLYLREDNSRTVQISASQATVPDPNGHKPAAFVYATPDGSKVFFLSCEKLTNDSTAVSTGENSCVKGSQGQDLYEYDTESEELTDLTVDSNLGDPLRANVLGLLGISDDGADVYFAANGVLAPGATLGACAPLNGTGGACSVYHSHNGVISLVARLNAATGGNTPGRDNWLQVRDEGPSNSRSSRVSANGTLVFTSADKLTSYDSQGRNEIYRYAPGDSAPICISCDPTLAPPIGGGDAHLVSKNNLGETFPKQKILQRNVSADGNRIFFETPDPLVPADTNGDAGCGPNFVEVSPCQDVYMWEAEGSGSCESDDANGGCLYLISSGSSPDAAYFGDNSVSGDDVFIFTGEQLVPQDEDELSDAYDVRVGGGLAAQHPAPPLPPCEGEACRGAGTVTPTNTGAGSAVFEGPADPKPVFKKCKKGKVLKNGKCVKKPKKKKKKKSKKRAGANGGGAK